MVSIKEVADYCGVSKATVSNVCHGRKNVSEKTAARIREAMKQLGYYPSFSASALSKGRTGIFGLFTGTGHIPYDDAVCGPLIKSLVVESQKKGMHLMILYDVDIDKMQQMLSGKGPIDGAIILTPIRDDYRAEFLLKQQIQTVLIGTPSGNTQKEILHVDINNIQISYEVTTRLIEKGCRQLLFLNSRADYSISQEREEGFYRALCDHNLDSSDSKIIHICEESPEALSAARSYLDTHQNRPGILNASAIPLSALLDGSDPRIPFFNFNSIEIDFELLGKHAFDLLYRALSGEKNLQSIEVPCKLELDGFVNR